MWEEFLALTLDKQAVIVIPIIAMIGGAVWKVSTLLSKEKDIPPEVKPSISIGGSNTTDNGSLQVLTAGDNNNVTVNSRDPQDKKIIDALLANQEVKDQQADNLAQQVKELEETIKALRSNEEQTGVQEALACLGKGNTGKAEQLFQETLERKKKEGRKSLKEAAAAACHLGSLYILHDTQKALQAYREATELDPKFTRAHITLQILIKAYVKYKEAEKVLLEAIRLDPKKATAHIDLGLFYGKQGKYKEAEKALLEALRLDPKNVVAHIQLRVVYDEQGKEKLAKKMRKKIGLLRIVKASTPLLKF